MKRAVAALALCLAASSAQAAGFKWRGVLEGFYGRPWTWQQRAGMVDWMSRRGMNLLVIAPKDDDAQRRRWREPLSSEYLGELSKLNKRAASKGISLGWTLSPLGIDPRRDAELAAALVKFRQVLGLGVRKLVIAFDDTAPKVSQVDFANRVLRDLAPDYPDLEMTFVPAVYWSGAAPSPYFDYLAATLDQRFLVAWTGPKIISQTISAEDGRRFRAYIRHKLVLGDNYPVQDRLLDSGPLFLGPLIGREAGLVDSQEAFVSNASPLPEASKLPLQTAADFMKDPEHYDPEASWRRAVKDLGGPQAAPWLELLARECAVSWISDPPPDWLRKESIGAAIADYGRSKDAKPLLARMKELSQVSSRLKSALVIQPALYAELRPWADKLSGLALVVTPAGTRAALIEAQENPAVVASLALDRFMLGAPLQGTWTELLGDLDQGTDRTADARDALSRLGTLAKLFPPTEDRGWPGGLMPWFQILGTSAQHAQAYAENPAKATFVPDLFWSWRQRVRMLPLMTDRALLERHFDLVESSWKTSREGPRQLGWLGVWLWFEGWVKPSAFPVTLQRQLARWSAAQDPGRLPELFSYLEALPARARAAAGPAFPPEMEPWLSKLAEYGKLGRMSLEYGRAPSAAQKDAWELQRDRLRSSNGLELAVKLKYALDAYARWKRLPAAERPRKFSVEWPADPSGLF